MRFLPPFFYGWLRTVRFQRPLARVSCRRSRMYGIQCKLVRFCPVIPYSTAFFFLPEPVSCRGQRIARSNGKRNRSFTKNIPTFAAVVEVLIAMFFFLFFFKVLQFEAFVCTTRCQDTSTKMYLAYRVLPKKKKKIGYHFVKYCNASTHQQAHRKICLTCTDHVQRHALPFYFFSTFNTTKHIFIDFVVLLH